MRFDINIKPIPQNQKLKRGRGNRLYLNQEFRTTWDAIKKEFEMIAFKNNYIPIFKPRQVKVKLSHNNMRADTDAFTKAVLDYLQGIAYDNDNQITCVVAIREKRAYPHLVVIVEETEGEAIE
jgi:Holliday junction resolvase RusA-like endonuclease